MCSFSQNKAKRIEDTKEAIPHTLDGLDVDKLLIDKIKLSPRNNLNNIPIFDKQLSREEVERHRRGITKQKKQYNKLDEDLWIERLNMFAERAMERNKIIKDEMSRYIVRDTKTQQIFDNHSVLKERMKKLKKICNVRKKVKEPNFEEYLEKLK